MTIVNVHERILDTTVADAGALIDSLSSAGDRLWPRRWPPMRLDGALEVGAAGGHGPIRYVVERYEPGRAIAFRFTGPEGFDGTHGYRVDAASTGGARLRHVLEMETRGLARLSWPLVFRPLHDALIEDSLDRAEREVGGAAGHRGWSWYVRLLRRVLSRRSDPA